MRILWASANFLHPTTKGGQIRTLEMLRQMHRRHEVHFVAFENPKEPEGAARAGEYCTKAYPVELAVPPRQSLGFARQIAGNLLTNLPLSIERYKSAAMRRVMRELMAEGFHSIVCDFLTPAPNIEDLSRCVLFEHNVETVIWERHAETAGNAVTRAYMRRQARRMLDYEGRICRAVRHVVAVSRKDAERLQSMFGLASVTEVSTGVDAAAFARPANHQETSDLVFTGSMDWMPNIDGIIWFVEQVMPLIWRGRPKCTLAVVGRKPPARVQQLGGDSRIHVTGTVSEVKPYLWGAKVAVVPLRIGGGTRLKIYEAMAAGLAVVSTTVGAEGLPLEHGRHILCADDADGLASSCLSLLANGEQRQLMAASARDLIAQRFSWDKVSRDFESILERHAVHI
jgi:polysaccharide biosynthesis protein PslH